MLDLESKFFHFFFFNNNKTQKCVSKGLTAGKSSLCQVVVQQKATTWSDDDKIAENISSHL